MKDRIAKLVQENSALSLKDLKINGNDLMDAGIPKGAVIGKILKELFETVTDSPKMNDKEALLNLAVNIYKEKFSQQ